MKLDQSNQGAKIAEHQLDWIKIVDFMAFFYASLIFFSPWSHQLCCDVNVWLGYGLSGPGTNLE